MRNGRPRSRIILVSLLQEPASHRFVCGVIGIFHDEGGIVIQGFEDHRCPQYERPVTIREKFPLSSRT
jgi:hypothetical protein